MGHGRFWKPYKRYVRGESTCRHVWLLVFARGENTNERSAACEFLLVDHTNVVAYTDVDWTRIPIYQL